MNENLVTIDIGTIAAPCQHVRKETHYWQVVEDAKHYSGQCLDCNEYVFWYEMLPNGLARGAVRE